MFTLCKKSELLRNGGGISETTQFPRSMKEDPGEEGFTVDTDLGNLRETIKISLWQQHKQAKKLTAFLLHASNCAKHIWGANLDSANSGGLKY